MREFPKIWFLRHGETEWNAEGRVQGQLESDLTPRGLLQAQRQAELIRAALGPLRPPCFVSPLRRAQRTAEIALAGHRLHTEPRLSEVHAGGLQGLTRDEIAQQYPQIDPHARSALSLFCAAPDGEGFARFHDRVLDLLMGLEAPSVLVAHGLLGQVLRGIICGLDFEEMEALPNEQGCIYVLEQGQETVLR